MLIKVMSHSNSYQLRSRYLRLQFSYSASHSRSTPKLLISCLHKCSSTREELFFNIEATWTVVSSQKYTPSFIKLYFRIRCGLASVREMHDSRTFSSVAFYFVCYNFILKIARKQCIIRTQKRRKNNKSICRLTVLYISLQL